jgi:type IV pilus assembly protein PilB
MGDPQNLAQIDEIERVTGLSVSPVLALESAITNFLPRCYERDFTVDAVTADLDRNSIQVETEPDTIDLGGADLLAEGSPVVNLINYIIVHATRSRASDIHIEPTPHATVVRFRVDGQLREILKPRREFFAALVSRIKVMAKLDIAEQRLPQDGRIHVAVEGRSIDLRVSTLPTIHGEKVVIRILDRQNVTFDLNRLGLPDTMLGPFKELLNRPHGLILVTGPTGSGKTTTLYSALELIKSVQRNIVTVEDPVEYQVDQINQVPVQAVKGVTFASALRSILRQDPDIIMVGEIRDAETAAVAVQAALTGHLVLSTLHTNDSSGAIARLIDMGVESYKLSAAIIGVVAQRLIRTNCPLCQRSYYPEPSLLEAMRYTGPSHRAFTRGEGCRECYDTGFRGRVGIYELLRVTPALRRTITDRPDLDAIREIHLREGGSLLMNEGLKVAERGLTSLEEVMRVAFVD